MTGAAGKRLLDWSSLGRNKFVAWKVRHGQVIERSVWIPEDFCPEGREKQAIIGFRLN